MNRRTFVGVAAGAALMPVAARADFVAARVATQGALFAALPAPKRGDWVRLVLGSGVAYQKQIGAASEATEHGERLYFETQVGTPGGSCNPNTMKRAYLRGSTYPSLAARVPVLAYVANSGTTLTRWSDVEGGQPQSPAEARLRLLDALYLYDERPLHVVSTESATVSLPAPTAYAGAEGSKRGAMRERPATHIVAEFAPPYDDAHRLKRIELWTAADVPFGVVRYRAVAEGLEPFDLHLFSYGTHFKTDLAMSLDTVRSVTPDGTYVETS